MLVPLLFNLVLDQTILVNGRKKTVLNQECNTHLNGWNHTLNLLVFIELEWEEQNIKSEYFRSFLDKQAILIYNE